MGEMSNEPSMEEILSSIKRIIAEEHDDSVAASARAERRARVREQSRRRIVEDDFDLDDEDEVLELTGGVAAPYGQSPDSAGKDAVMGNDSEYVKAIENAIPPAATRVSAIPTGRKRAAPVAPEAAEDVIVSPESETAARSSLAALSSMVMKPQAEGESNTLEGLVREMLRPMLKQWLDANLPELVEGMVAKEIARITGRSL